MQFQKPSEHLSLVVSSLTLLSTDVVVVELSHPEERALPPFTAGAHIDFRLPNGLIRSYSLLNNEMDRKKYTVAVLRDSNSRGGSLWIHDSLMPGQLVSISAPRNNFPLRDSSARTVFLAGGIGVTPFLSMLHRFSEDSALGSAHLIYCVKSKEAAPFLPQLESMASPRISFEMYCDADHAGPPNIENMLGAHQRECHFYACGPGPMLSVFERICADLQIQNFFLERFKASEQIPESSPVVARSSTIILAKSGLSIPAKTDRSILSYLREAGIESDYSCEEGICGTCETRILEGEVEHRDEFLNIAEKAAGKMVVTCVSRCKSPCLILDL